LRSCGDLLAFLDRTSLHSAARPDDHPEYEFDEATRPVVKTRQGLIKTGMLQ
jgi:hypothetical protein